MVIASALVTVLIVVGAVVVIAVLFVVLGPLSRQETVRDEVEAETVLGQRLTEDARDELLGEEGPSNVDDEARLDRENE
jgi:HAMP domain-containing protein